MFRIITVVNTPTYLLEILAELKGKKIEILAFEIENSPIDHTFSTEKMSFLERTKHLAFDSKGYQFNSD